MERLIEGFRRFQRQYEAEKSLLERGGSSEPKQSSIAQPL